MVTKLSSVAALLGVVGAIGAGFVQYGKVMAKIEELDNRKAVINQTVDLSPLEEKISTLEVELIDRINVVEEQGMLSAAESFLQKNGFNDFAKELIPPQLILEAQKVYLGELNKHIDTTSADKVYIDKLPLNLLEVPLIHQLYPDAKFILALRHPMDTILSCWMQNFKLNAAMANMVDLDRIVDFYCIAMETFEICRSNYNLNVYEIRYEDLINNFQMEAVVHF